MIVDLKSKLGRMLKKAERMAARCCRLPSENKAKKNARLHLYVLLKYVLSTL